MILRVPRAPRGAAREATARPIVVGSGLAGLWTAWRLATCGRPCLLLTKGSLQDGATGCAQGGIAAAISPGDSAALHAADTLAAGDGLSDAEAVRALVTEGPRRLLELAALGVVFDREPGGGLALGLEAAHCRPRILHAGGDRTGAELVRGLAKVVVGHPAIEVHEQAEAADLLLESGTVAGVVAVVAGAAVALPAPAVILATGGVGWLFDVTTNPPVATGDGWALAHRAGARLRHLEFLQFHPTTLKVPGAPGAVLISEALRGAGAVLLDRDGRRFLEAEDPRAELAPRHIVARAVAAADHAGGAWLDARAVPGVAERFPGLTTALAGHGLQPARDLLPVAPAMHYAMGGVATDLAGRTSVPGLWAVGEVACTGVHGANRLASNSLLEALVFADRAARALAETPAEPPRPLRLGYRMDLRNRADDDCEPLRGELRTVMAAGVGIVRSEATLARAACALSGLAAAAPPTAWRTRSQILVARLIVEAARSRRETRGSHTRSDYPIRADALS